MRQQTPETCTRNQQAARQLLRSDYLFQAILWSVWTLAIVAIAYASWHADLLAQRPFNLLGMSIHCAVGGVIGLIVLTLAEMRLRPWRFLDERQ